jgi:hypothetical protein
VKNSENFAFNGRITESSIVSWIDSRWSATFWWIGELLFVKVFEKWKLCIKGSKNYYGESGTLNLKKSNICNGKRGRKGEWESIACKIRSYRVVISFGKILCCIENKVQCFKQILGKKVSIRELLDSREQ